MTATLTLPARVTDAPADFPPPERNTTVPLQYKSCPDCGWFVHYVGNPMHANCKSMQEEMAWKEHDDLMRTIEELNRYFDALENVILRTYVVLWVQPVIDADTSPYELLWRFMMD